MELKTRNEDNVIIIFLKGRLDIHHSSDIENGINDLMKSNPDSHMLLNLKDVEYMSSSGLRIFVSTMRTLKESNKLLKLCNMNNSVKKIFEVVELIDMFDIYNTEEEALVSFKSQ